MKKIFIIIPIVLISLIFIGLIIGTGVYFIYTKVGNDITNIASQNSHSSNSSNENQDSQKHEETEKNDINSENEETEPTLKVTELSLYNKIVDSNYMSVVLYDPNKENYPSGTKKTFDKSIVALINTNESVIDNFVKSDFKLVASQNSKMLYYFALGKNENIIPSCISTSKIDDGVIDFSSITSKDAKYEYFTSNSIYTSTRKKTYTKENEIKGSNWFTTKSNNSSKSTNNISLRIGENDDEYITAFMHLNKDIPYGNSFNEDVDKEINDNNFKYSLYTLNDTDNLNSIVSSYGETVDLTKTVVYQDIVATKISDVYGLNLKNKDYFTKLDTVVIKYQGYGSDDKLTVVEFNPVLTNQRNDEDFENYYSYYSPDLEYTDKNGVEYFYSTDDSNGTVAVFRNLEYVGKITVTHNGKKSDNQMAHLSELFGIKEYTKILQ